MVNGGKAISLIMVIKQKPPKRIMFTANAQKMHKVIFSLTKICYNLPLHTQDEDHFNHPQILKLASGTRTEWILNRDKNIIKFIKK